MTNHILLHFRSHFGSGPMLAALFFGRDAPPAAAAPAVEVAAPAPPAAVPAPPVIAPPAPPPVVDGHGRGGRGRGRGRGDGRHTGFVQSPLAKARIRGSMLTRTKARALRFVSALSHAASGAEIVTAFHSNVDSLAQGAKRQFRVALLPGAAGFSIPVNARNQTLASRNRIVCSQVQAQAGGIAEYISHPGSHPRASAQCDSFYNFSNAFDDASMWMNKEDMGKFTAPLFEIPANADLGNN